MITNAAQDYALRMCAHLARKGGTASSAEIAEAAGAPRDYLVRIAQLLRDEGIVEARPGKHGGYRLANRPEEISVADIAFAVDGSVRDGRGAECAVVETRVVCVLSSMVLEEVAGECSNSR